MLSYDGLHPRLSTLRVFQLFRIETIEMIEHRELAELVLLLCILSVLQSDLASNDKAWESVSFSPVILLLPELELG